MSRILCVLMAVLALCALIDCNDGHVWYRVEDGDIQHDICSIVGCVNQKQLIRKKRENGRAVAILGGVQRLITGILDSALGNIKHVPKPKGEERINIGSGGYNNNTVTLDDYEYE